MCARVPDACAQHTHTHVQRPRWGAIWVLSHGLQLHKGQQKSSPTLVALESEGQQGGFPAEESPYTAVHTCESVPGFPGILNNAKYWLVDTHVPEEQREGGRNAEGRRGDEDLVGTWLRPFPAHLHSVYLTAVVSGIGRRSSAQVPLVNILQAFSKLFGAL